MSDRSQPVVRRLTDGEVDGYYTCLDHAFGRRSQERFRELENGAIGVDRMFGAFVGTEVVGTAASFRLELTVPGLALAPTAGVTSVAVLPTHRRRGLMTSLMRHQLEDMRDRGEPLAALSASEGGIYRRFGYGVATYASRYEIDKQQARLYRPLEELAEGSVRVVTPGQAEEIAPPLFDAARRLRAGEVGALPQWWESAFGEPSLTELDPKTRFFAAYEEDGRVDGYVDYLVVADPADRHRRHIQVEMLFSVSLAAYAALWNFLLGIDLTSHVSTHGRPVDEPLKYLLVDHRQMRTLSHDDDLWVRLVDVRAALAARSYPNAPGEGLVLDVVDTVCRWNDGVYRLDVADDGSAVVEGPSERDTAGLRADLTMDVSSLGSAYLGGVRVSDLAKVRRIDEHVAGRARRADILFSGDGEPYCSLGF